MDLNMSPQRRFRRVLAVALVAISSGTAAAQQPITDSQMIESDSPTINNPMPPTSPQDLRARVGEKFTEPPPVPSVPQSLTEPVYVSAETPLTLQTIEFIACARNPTL